MYSNNNVGGGTEAVMVTNIHAQQSVDGVFSETDHSKCPKSQVTPFQPVSQHFMLAEFYRFW